MKLKINNDVMIDDFFEETRLLGIVAPIEQYRFCWHLNQNLNFDFRINNNIEIQLNKKTRKYFFPIYQYGQQAGTIQHFLYNNEDDGEYLLPEFKHLDFLWLMKDDMMSETEITIFKNTIKDIPSVQMVIELTNEKIKNRQHLVF
ncbi:MAG: IPExxxVDY family protein [Ginsengibacter sp.]